jgi:hypothetical protein
MKSMDTGLNGRFLAAFFKVRILIQALYSLSWAALFLKSRFMISDSGL